ncbi:methyltransferase domain-containing protein [Dongia sp.]|uniref:methyltransferase domain-containing protein n=1 Tax=Dongia sp. TaxID=1977262 RepID=UPI0035AF9EFF
MKAVRHTLSNNCFLCGTELAVLSGEYRTYLRPFDAVEISRYGYCRHCDFAQCLNPLDGEATTAYYENNYQFRRKEITATEARHVSEQVRIASAAISEKVGPSVLEVGPDNGSFLAIMQSATNADCYYDELNPDSIKILNSYGFKPIAGMGQQPKFDLIVIRHVLEHIASPTEYVANVLKQRLKPDGVIFVEVPDYTYVRSAWSDIFQFEHVNYFSLTSMHVLSKKAGLTIESVSFAQTAGYATSPNRVIRVCLKNTSEPTSNAFDIWQKFLRDQTETYNDFRALLGNTKRLALYGAGTHTVSLLANCDDPSTIAAIYDADPNKIGTVLLGIKVQPAEAVDQNAFDKLLVTVVGYEAEVIQFLKSKNVPDSKIVSLSKLLKEGSDK